MNIEEMKQAALSSAEKNGGLLTRLTNGRFQGLKPGPQFDRPLITLLLKENKLTVSRSSPPMLDDEGKVVHGMTGRVEEVRLA